MNARKLLQPRYSPLEAGITLFVALLIVEIGTLWMAKPARVNVTRTTAATSPLPAVKLAEMAKADDPNAYRRPYTFTSEWFTTRLPSWKVALAPYVGRSGLSYLEFRGQLTNLRLGQGEVKGAEFEACISSRPPQGAPPPFLRNNPPAGRKRASSRLSSACCTRYRASSFCFSPPVKAAPLPPESACRAAIRRAALLPTPAGRRSPPRSDSRGPS